MRMEEREMGVETKGGGDRDRDREQDRKSERRKRVRETERHGGVRGECIPAQAYGHTCCEVLRMHH